MKKQDLVKKLAELDQLRDALLGQVASLSNDEKIKALEAAQPKVEPGTPEMEALLHHGYHMTAEEAEHIIASREKDPHTYPFDVYQSAKAFLAAYNATAEVVSTREPWQTRPRA